MLSSSISKFISSSKLWMILSVSILLLYLYPLFDISHLYVLEFDNLDSNIVWNKILASSGKIFAPNHEIIPNMMSGLPRSSYGSEFDIILWLYYLFSPPIAYAINEAIIHIVAFLSAIIFLNRYMIIIPSSNNTMILYVTSLFFALLPFWSGAGVTIAILPLVTYSLLNIKFDRDTKWDWLILILLPLYSSLILFFVFYIIMASLWLLYDAIKHRGVNIKLLLALSLMSILFLLSQYRVLIAMFFDSGFISHRTEFSVFFQKSMLDSYRQTHFFFLNGHLDHLFGTQMPYVIPIVLISMLMSISKKVYSANESMIIWVLITISFAVGFWQHSLAQLYTLSILIVYVSIIYLFTDKYRIFILLFMLQFLLAFFIYFEFYEGFRDLASNFPLLKVFNISRLSFLQPLIWLILLMFSLSILNQKLKYATPFILIFMVLQVHHSIDLRFFKDTPSKKYSTFSQYYAPELLNKVKKAIPEDIEDIRVVSFGIEPAVSLYNNFYTIDGYSTNYPLEYKHKFKSIIEGYTPYDVYEKWGSKVYITSLNSALNNYLKDMIVHKQLFSTNALCKLNTKYIISGYKLDITKYKNLTYIDSFYGDKDSWDITLYKLNCKWATKEID